MSLERLFERTLTIHLTIIFLHFILVEISLDQMYIRGVPSIGGKKNAEIRNIERKNIEERNVERKNIDRNILK